MCVGVFVGCWGVIRLQALSSSTLMNSLSRYGPVKEQNEHCNLKEAGLRASLN